MELGYIRKTDSISLNRDQQLNDAKQIVLGLSKFYKPPKPALIPVMGENFRGICEAVLYNMRHGNYISDYDFHIARKLGHIISGGDCAEGTYVTEQEILDLEREAFLSLCGEQKTQDRIMSLLLIPASRCVIKGRRWRRSEETAAAIGHFEKGGTYHERSRNCCSGQKSWRAI